MAVVRGNCAYDGPCATMFDTGADVTQAEQPRMVAA
jgi:hypothetical protein